MKIIFPQLMDSEAVAVTASVKMVNQSITCSGCSHIIGPGRGGVANHHHVGGRRGHQYDQEKEFMMSANYVGRV